MTNDEFPNDERMTKHEIRNLRKNDHLSFWLRHFAALAPRPLLASSFGLLVSSFVILSFPVFAADKVTYANDVLPILRNSCLSCHNPDKDKAGLDVYLPHPAHDEFKTVLRPHLDKVLVIDFVAQK